MHRRKAPENSPKEVLRYQLARYEVKPPKMESAAEEFGRLPKDAARRRAEFRSARRIVFFIKVEQIYYIPLSKMNNNFKGVATRSTDSDYPLPI